MLFDLHVHTKEGSPCAHAPAREIVRLYKENGFDGIVITDHISRGYMEGVHKFSYDDYCKLNYETYLEAKDEGDKIGLTVLHGCELQLDTTGNNDYLVYGISYEFLKENPDIMSWRVKRLKEECEKNGLLFYQAHPFRDYATVIEPQYLYGVETVNGAHIQYNNSYRNEIATLWASKYNFHRIAGSDCHSVNGVGLAGVKFFSEIKDNAQLVKALSEDNYSIIQRVPTSV